MASAISFTASVRVSGEKDKRFSSWYCVREIDKHVCVFPLDSNLLSNNRLTRCSGFEGNSLPDYPTCLGNWDKGNAGSFILI